MKRGNGLQRKSRLKAKKPLKKRGKRGVKLTKLDDMIRPFVYARDGHACIVEEDGKRCNRKPLNMHHIREKSRYPQLRYTMLNLMTLCYYHHIHCWHENRDWANELMRRQFPLLDDQLTVLAVTTPKVDKEAVMRELSGS